MLTLCLPQGEAYFVLRDKFSHLLEKPTEDEHCEIRHSDEEDAACREVDESALQHVVETSTAAGNGGNVCAELDQLPQSEHDEDILEVILKDRFALLMKIYHNNVFLLWLFRN